ncbi:hypothetical protein Tco_0387096 [Tanacetum coccineum]
MVTTSMNTKIFHDNESTICIVKNPMFHSKTKHIKIRHHFIRDSNEKKLIQNVQIHHRSEGCMFLVFAHKRFDVADFNILIASIRRLHSEVLIWEVNCVKMQRICTFWQTATASTLDNGEMEITAIIDGKIKIVTEASIMRHLKLEDSDGISNLPTTEIFEQLALMGSPPHTNVADEAASTSVYVRYGGAATTVTGLEAGQGSGNIDKTPNIPHDSPLPRVHTLGSDEGRMQHNELMDLVTKLSDRVVALETYLTQTKKVYGVDFTKLIKKVKRLEKQDKLSKSRRKLRLVLSDEEGSDLDILAQEDPSKQGRKIA